MKQEQAASTDAKEDQNLVSDAESKRVSYNDPAEELEKGRRAEADEKARLELIEMIEKQKQKQEEEARDQKQKQEQARDQKQQQEQAELAQKKQQEEDALAQQHEAQRAETDGKQEQEPKSKDK